MVDASLQARRHRVQGRSRPPHVLVMFLPHRTG